MMKRSHAFLMLVSGMILFGFIKQARHGFGTPPKALPVLDTALTSFTWNSLVEAHFAYFADTLLTAEGEITQATFGGVDWVNPNGMRTKAYLLEPQLYNALVKKFYRSPAQQYALYKWVRPVYKEAFKKLPAHKKRTFRNMLQHAKKYLATFNYQAESEFYKKHEANFNPKSPKEGIRKGFGRMEAFIVRRIRNRDMTLEQMSNWVNTIQADLAGLY